MRQTIKTMAVLFLVIGLALLLFAAGVVLPLAPASGATAGWTRQFGTSGADEAQGVALDSGGNAYVVGWVFRALPQQASSGTVDAFVRKYDALGNEVWTRQLGTDDTDLALAVAVDGTGHAHAVGSTRGTLPGQASAGSRDAVIVKVP